MGDMADALTDDGIEQLAAHNSGNCEGPCPYCDGDMQMCEACGLQVAEPGMTTCLGCQAYADHQA